jgi:hypothetical protein
MDNSNGVGRDRVYPYAGVPLAPSTFEALAPRLFGGTVVKRQDVIRAVVEEHRRLGGLPAAPGVVVESQAKRALQRMCKAGVATNAGSGHYRFVPSENDEAVEPDEAGPEPGEVELGDAGASTFDLPPERVIGDGPEMVYVYYLPTYRRLAEVEGRDRWACKVGYTRGLVSTRVLGQATTALPEIPVVGLALKGTRCRELEATIHGMLGLNGRRIEGIPGREWFETSPVEVERIYRMLTAPLADDTASAPASG